MDNSVPCHPTPQALIDPYVPGAHSAGTSRTTGYQVLAEQAVHAASKKRSYAQQYEDHMVLAPRQLPPCDVLHIPDRRRTVTLQTQFLVHWALEYLTKQDVADQVQLGFESVEIGAPTGDETTNRRKKLKSPSLRKCKLCDNPLGLGNPSLGGLPVTHCRSRNYHVAIHTTCSQHHPEWQCRDCARLGIPPTARYTRSNGHLTSSQSRQYIQCHRDPSREPGIQNWANGRGIDSHTTKQVPSRAGTPCLLPSQHTPSTLT